MPVRRLTCFSIEQDFQAKTFLLILYWDIVILHTGNINISNFTILESI